MFYGFCAHTNTDSLGPLPTEVSSLRLCYLLAHTTAGYEPLTFCKLHEGARKETKLIPGMHCIRDDLFVTESILKMCVCLARSPPYQYKCVWTSLKAVSPQETLLNSIRSLLNRGLYAIHVNGPSSFPTRLLGKFMF